MIRLFLCALVFLLFFTIYQINLLIYHLIKLFDREKATKYLQKATFIFLDAIKLSAGVKAEVIGIENLDKAYELNKKKFDGKKGLVFISNHRSFFDVVCGYPIVNIPTGFISKKELELVPFFYFWLKYNYCLSIDRADVRQGMKVVLNAIEYVNKGISMWIFPEGTRLSDNEKLLNEFKGGAFAIASKTDAIIAPIVFLNTERVFEEHIPFIKSERIKIIIKEPIDVSLLSKDEKKDLPNYTYTLIKSTIEEYS